MTNAPALRAAVLVACAAPLAPAQGFGIGSGSIAQLYEQNCAKCHNADASGGGAGTRTMLTPEHRDKPHRDYFNLIRDGNPDAGMPAFADALSNEQAWALVVYVRELQEIDHRKRVGSPRPADGVYPTQRARFTIERVVDSGVEVPWAAHFLPERDGRYAMLLTERPGRLRIHSTGRAGGTLSAEVAGTPRVRDRGQGGLMDVAVHPDYPTNGWVYLSYSDPLDQGGRSAGMTRIVRGKIAGTPQSPAWTNEQTVWRARPEHYLATDLHFGCKIVFDTPAPDGRRPLFFGIGERGRMEMAQDLTRPNGKVHRTWDDGAIPDDNPFVGRPDVYESIWSYGHRNPQGLIRDLAGNLWDTEHGPRGGDELNLIHKGRNWRWPVVSFGINYQGTPFRHPFPDLLDERARAAAGDIAMPAFVWLPSIGASGLDVVGPGPAGEAFPEWRGDLLAGGLSGRNLDRFRLKVENGVGVVVEREEILHGLGRVRDVAIGPDGSVYVVLNGPDRVIRLTPVGER